MRTYGNHSEIEVTGPNVWAVHTEPGDDGLTTFTHLSGPGIAGVIAPREHDCQLCTYLRYGGAVGEYPPCRDNAGCAAAANTRRPCPCRTAACEAGTYGRSL